MEGPTVMAVPVSVGQGLTFGQPQALFEGRHWPGNSQYDVSADGQRFLFSERASDEESKIRVVLNWHEEFRDREQD